MKESYRNSLYFFSLSPAVLVIIGNLNGSIYSAANFFYSLIILGLLEWLTPAFTSNKHSKKSDIIPKLILLLHIPFQLLSLLSLFYGLNTHALVGGWIWMAALSTGLNSGTSAIVVAHEFIHCRKRWEKQLGKFLLFTAGNFYFYIEHLVVHHMWVGTDKDNATAKYGESLYSFFSRSVIGQVKGAYSQEAKRLLGRNKKAFSLHNYVIGQMILHLILIVFLFIIFGGLGILAWLIQCLVANFLLEYVNYIQHYGLNRDEKQRTTEEHSWESNQFASRFVLVDLSRHADHHYFAAKPYHTLDSFKKSPKLPSGYAGLFFIAAVPFLWRKLVHERLRIFEEEMASEKFKNQ